MNKRKQLLRLSPFDNPEKWLNDFSVKMVQMESRPLREVFSSQNISDWRISYGIYSITPEGYFLAFYPPFCMNHKALFHYNRRELLANDVFEIETFLADIDKKTVGETDAQDIIAVLFYVLKQREPGVLTEQLELTKLGLQHHHLKDSYFSLIKKSCLEWRKQQTILGKTLKVSLLGGFGGRK